jgi:hypothetical protein
METLLLIVAVGICCIVLCSIAVCCLLWIIFKGLRMVAREITMFRGIVEENVGVSHSDKEAN